MGDDEFVAGYARFPAPAGSRQRLGVLRVWERRGVDPVDLPRVPAFYLYVHGPKLLHAIGRGLSEIAIRT